MQQVAWMYGMICSFYWFAKQDSVSEQVNEHAYETYCIVYNQLIIISVYEY